MLVAGVVVWVDEVFVVGLVRGGGDAGLLDDCFVGEDGGVGSDA